MAFKTKLEYVNLNNTGTLLSVVDVTGYYNETNNNTGYGTPNPINFNSISFAVNRFNSSLSKKLVQSVTYPIDELPTMAEIIAGEIVHLDSFSLGITGEFDGTSAFADGIIEVNMIHQLDPIIAKGIKDENFVTGLGLTKLRNYDFITANGHIYRIDRTNYANNDTVIFLTEPLLEDCSEVQQTLVSDLKVLVTTGAEELLAKAAAKISVETCGSGSTCNLKSKTKEILSRVIVNRMAADKAFDCLDFKRAHDLTSAVYLELQNIDLC